MKPLTSFLGATLAAMLVIPATTAAVQERDAAKSETLQVQVDIPPTWRPMFEDRITDAFVSRIRDVFRSQGYSGKIEHVTDFDEPASGCCLLTIHLVEWRARFFSDNIECTFTASLQTGEAIRELGVFSDRTFRWMHSPGRFGLAESFGEAADGAIRQLYDRLAKTDLVPGIRKS